MTEKRAWVSAGSFGHTGITWPFTPAGAKQAISDIAACGYGGVELFGFVLDVYPGGVDAVGEDLAAAGLEYAASYCSVSLVDPGKRDADLASMRRWAGQVKALGGSVAVVGPDQRTRVEYDSDDYATIAQALNQIGRLTAEFGVYTCFHPHTLTPVETREAIAQVMDRIDPAVVCMAPDTGQIAKGGGDPVEVVRTYRDLVRHLHLKDYIGGVSTVDWVGGGKDRTGYLDYTPVGEGVVDIAGVLAAIGPSFPGWVMVELDATDNSERPAIDAARTSKKNLESIIERMS
ncbi:MAG: sugar phosphate isomerase/epimerase [Propionibacteriaceae bacterium]|jgi:inosose dehydratase|nr:sugar phosphate isomerase/epimerase [Propionibacteriaceae bacterium]